jgi:hypothetical protein
VWCSCPARAAFRFAGKGIELAELPIPAKHRYGAGHKIASAWPYNVAQLYAMLGESIRRQEGALALMARYDATG